MRHVLFDLRFILRNWRYFHAHGVLTSELREWWNDYDPPKPSVDYSVNVNVGANTAALIQDLQRAAASHRGLR